MFTAVVSVSVNAAVPTDENFDGVALGDVGGTMSFGTPGAPRTINNWTFTLLNAAGTQDTSINAYVDVTNDSGFTSLADDGADKAALLNGNFAGGTGNAAAVFKATLGEEFAFISVRVENGASAGTDYRLVGYLNGSPASGATQNFNAGAFGSGGTLVTVTGVVWQYLDEIRVVRQNGATDVSIYIDDIDIGPAVSPDATPPTVTSVNSSTADGAYKVGDVISIQVNFSEPVTVNTGGGTPQLTLETGTTDRTINYASGSGTSTLTFNYTVQAGDTTADLDYVASTSLTLNGATIRDAASNNATLTLPSPGAANSLGANKALVIDGVAPTVSSVSVPANATYITGQNLDFTINFNDNVTVNTGGGTPQLSITVGATTRQATYQSGSGTGALLFRYTVQAGESDADGIAVGTLSANGGTLRDAASNDANLTLNSVGATASVLVDATAPAVTSVTVPANATYIAGQNLDFTINFGENVTVNTGGGTPQLSITVGAITRQATYQSGSGTGALLFRYTVQAGESDADGIAVGTLSANGGTLRDAASNDANLTLNSVGSTTSILVDAAAPSVTSIAPTGSPAANAASMDFAVAFDESVSNISTDDFTLVSTDSASGTIASVSAASGSSVTVTVNAITGTGTLKLNLNGSTNIVDAAGNGIAAYSSGTTHTVDRDAPAAPSTPDLDAASDTGASNTDNVTSDNTPTFTGTAEVNATVTIISSLSGTLGTTTADGSGDWSYTAGAMVNGIHNITATATDAAGNVSSASAALAVTIDGPVTVTTNADSGADATIDGSLATDIADGGGLSLREALAYVTAGGTVDFAAGLSGTTITLGAPLSVPASITLDTDALGEATITGSTFTLMGSLNLTNGTDDKLTLASELTGVGALIKAGAGRLILTNANNTNSYSGTTMVSAGELSIGSDSNLGSGALSIASGSILDITGATTIDNAIALSGNATISNSAAVTLSGTISGTNNLTKSGSGTLTLSGTNSYGGTTVSAGTLSIADDANLGSGGITLNNSTLAVTSAGTIDNAITLANDGTLNLAAATSLTGELSGQYRLAKWGLGDLTIANSNNANMTGEIAVFEADLLVADGSYMPSTVVLRGGNLIFTDTTTVSSVIAIQANATISNDNDVALNNVIELSDSNHTLTKAGTGRLTLASTANSQFMAGNVVVASGILSVSDDRHLNSGDITINGGTLAITATGIYDNNLVIGASNAVIEVPNNVTATLVGGLTGVGGLGKTGMGSLGLSGTGSFTGATTVSAGALLVNGSTASGTTVASGSLLGGAGTMGGNVTVQSGGTLSPGNSAGSLIINGNLSMNAGSTLALEINGSTAGVQYDRLLVNGTVSVAGATVSATHNYTAGQGDFYTIIVNDGVDAIVGTFSGLSEGGTLTAGGNSTVLTASYAAGTGNDFILIAPINTAPVIADLNGDSISFIEDSTAILLDANSNATVIDADSADFNGGNVTVAITSGRVDAEDVLSIRNQGTGAGQIGLSGADVTYGGVQIGTVNLNGGTGSTNLIISLNSSATPASVQALVRNLTYINTNTTEPTTTSRTASVTINDGDGGTSTAANVTVGVTATNDAPTLTATAANPTFTEGGSAVALFSGALINTVEAGESINSLVLTVANLANGSDEVLSVDGTNIQLTNGNSTTTLTNGFNASVSVVATTATVTLSKLAGVSVADAQTVVNGITYANSSITPIGANRVVTITSLQDSGGTANGGVDTFNPNIASTVTIDAVNSAPVVTTTADATDFVEGNNVASVPVIIDAGFTVTDADNTTLASATVSITTGFATAEDVLAFTNDGATMGNIAASYDAGTGVLTLTSSSATATLAEWQAALAAVTYTNSSDAPSTATRTISFVVNDGTDDSIASTKDVTVTATNDAPIFLNSPSLLVAQDANYSYIPSVTDADSVLLVFSITNQPVWASFNPSTGELSGAPNAVDVGVFASIVISVNDGVETVSLPAFDITVTNVNDAPTIGGLPATSVAQDTPYSFTPSADDIDVGDVLTFSITNKPSWAVFDPATGALTGTPTNADVGTTTGIVITVSDGSLSASRPAFDLTVTNVNDAPVISGTPATSVDQDVAYSFTPTASDIDVGDVLTYSITNKPSWAAFDPATGALTGTPTNADVGTTTGIVITVNDGTVDVSLAPFNLTVTNVNDAPVISGTPTTSVDQDVAYSFTPTASDIDVGDVLTYSITNKPSWAVFDPATGALTGTPTNADVDTTTGIVITVNDGTVDVSLAPFNLTVTNVNDAPVISGTPTTSVDQDVAYSFTPTVSDIDVGDVLTYSITNKPSWAVFDPATGALTGTPTNADVGTTTGIVITVNDGTVDVSLAPFSLTVTNVNDAPVISGTPTTSVDQDVAYSFTPTVSDIDVGDVLTYSITNKPSWAVFDPATGALTGTPTNADVGTTTGIVITVNDGTVDVSLAPFNLTVTNVNDAPVISGTPATSVDQDEAYSFVPTASDVDTDAILTFTITNKPTWAAFDTATGALTGTPVKANVGVTTGIIITVSDGVDTASLPAFDLTVVNVNAEPVISGTPTLSIDMDTLYSFAPVASDLDIADVLSFTISNKPAWAMFDAITGELTGTPTEADVGVFANIIITVSDGVLSASLPAFNLEVIRTIDPLQPIVTAPADIVINATALYTPVSLRQLLSLSASATQDEVDALLNSMASDGVSGNTCCTTNPEGLNVNNALLLPPGRHEVKWNATNAADVTGSATQIVDIRPLVSFSKSQIAIRGSAVEFHVLLNGKAPEYPFTVAYEIDAASTAGTGEHNLVNGTVEFATAGQVKAVVPVQLASLSGLSDSELIVRLADGLNAGVANTHRISIREGNIAPMLSLRLSQNGVNTANITPTDGPVTVTATVVDLNPGDTHSFDWSATDSVLADTDGNPVDATLVFDPANLTGRHQVQLTVTDAGGASANVQLYFRVVASQPVLSADVDTDGDGIDDLTEGYGDTSGNGIPDYLDNMPSTNVVPQQGSATTSYLIECDPGVRCGLGLFALGSNSGGVQILDEELGTMTDLVADTTFEPVGGIFDFVIRDLPTPGQSVRIVIPQAAAIPANATYRKYQEGRWVSFIENANNAIFSAPGNPGYCPPPGNPEWTSGLTEGHLCVQLTIEDGGPNDDDGLVNSAVADPGAVSVELEVVEPPPPPEPKPPVEVKSKGGGAMGGLWLLVLGGLMLFKRVKPVWIALAALVAASVNTQAAENKGFYLRADIAGVTSSVEKEDFSSVLSAAGYDFNINRFDASRSGFQLALGLQWERHLYTELGYLDLGDVKVDLTLDGETDLGDFSQDFAASYPLSAEGLTLVQGIMLTPDAPIKISAEVGVFIWRNKIDIEEQVFAVDKDEGEDVLVGVKLDIPVDDKFGFGVGLRRIYFDDQTTNVFSLIGSYHF
ncbi:putative Ig domain-containing protein [Cellvibrio sp. NN19]|uniref:putative Ig domain-containing protein n=1 Tax=Cellvibrio chitinivorans TaxID=3102792 RepID=UPI002B405724|nr:putative Ig domain-containing protein [Cellvibrio sp. NN19]